MPKFYKRYPRRTGPKDKYSVEQQAAVIDVAAGGQQAVQLITPTTTQGMRKVKHLTISVASNGATSASAIYWAIVYVPQGTTPNPLALGTGSYASLYEPNQFVMNCGVMDLDAGPARVATPLSRNLNSGDSIYVILANPAGAAMQLQTVVRYAITLQ